MAQNWLVLIPPFLVLLVAFIKRNVILALFSGIISATFIATNFSILESLKLTVYRIFNETHIPRIFTGTEAPDHVYTFIFLIALGVLISLITHTGGMSAYSRVLLKRLHTKKSTQTTSLLLSLGFFLDDYLNNLMTGSIMRPLTDKFKIPRAKLAFLLDSMSGPLCLVVPASSWIAFIITQLGASGISEKSGSVIIGDPFGIYLNSLPYLFYPLLLIASSWFIIRRNISFGAMYTQEQIAQETGNLFGNKPPLELKTAPSKHEGSLIDFIVPLGSFLVLFMGMLLYTGHYFTKPDQTFLKAIHEANSIYALFIASIAALIISITFYLVHVKLSLQEIAEVFKAGFLLMKNSLLVLLLAWTLGTILTLDLGTGNYLAHLLLKAIPAFALPLMVFITALIITASTGSTWGTIAVVMPLAIPAVVTFSGNTHTVEAHNLTLLYPVIGALLSGSIAGGHISPISDSTVMSSLSAGSYQMDHLVTQISYVIPVIIATIAALLLSALFISYNKISIIALSFTLSIIPLFVYFYARDKNKNKS